MKNIQRNKERNFSLSRRETVNLAKTERKKKRGGVTKEDKLSQLPDEIILRVLFTLIGF